MMTTNGLHVPGPGEGAHRGHLRLVGSPAHGSRVSGRQDRPRRWVNAEDAQPGDHLVGPRTKGRYQVLAVVPDVASGMVTLTVLAPSGLVRDWVRDRHFGLERA